MRAQSRVPPKARMFPPSQSSRQPPTATRRRSLGNVRAFAFCKVRRLSDRGRSVRISGVREIAERYRTWFVDAYGVLHDGSAAFPGAVDALTRARRAGVTVVIVTNSGQRIDAVAA